MKLGNQYYQMAMKQEFPEAYFHMGVVYHLGLGITKDERPDLLENTRNRNELLHLDPVHRVPGVASAELG